jgi:hypothetical protein
LTTAPFPERTRPPLKLLSRRAASSGIVWKRGPPRGEDHLPFGEAAVESLEEAAELHVEAAKSVEVLLRLGAVGVGDRVLGRQREAEGVRLLLVPQLEVLGGEDLQGEVHRQLVDERAVVDAVEVAARSERQVLVPAEAVHRDLERADLERGNGVCRGRRPEREEGVGHLPPGQAETAGEVPAGTGPVELGDNLRRDGAAWRCDVVGGGRDETARDLVPPVDRVLPPLPGHEDGPPVLARKGDDPSRRIALEESVSERRNPQVRRARAEDRGLCLRVGERLIGAVDLAEGAVLARLEPAVRDDPGDARRGSRSERGVTRSCFRVQVGVVRIPLHVPLVEQPLQSRDEIRPIVEQPFHLEAVDRNEDCELRRADRGRGRLLPGGLCEREEGDGERNAEGEGGKAEFLHCPREGRPVRATLRDSTAGQRTPRWRRPKRE